MNNKKSLSVSIVTYNPDMNLLYMTMNSLAASVNRAFLNKQLYSIDVVLIDNGPGRKFYKRLFELAETTTFESVAKVRIISEHGNIGYGQGHNKGIESSDAEYHLVLNPDVILDTDAISNAMQFMTFNDKTGLLSPKVEGRDGQQQFLIVRYPDILTLMVRGIGSLLGVTGDKLKLVFKKKIDHYQMKDINWENMVYLEKAMISGCFMFFNKKYLDQIRGFSRKYFLYFEDYDISIRIAQISDIVYEPEMKIIHYGGDAARKGAMHIKLFLKSAITFYAEHGLKWI